ncbi:hypothetical protein ABTE28_20315, partial [Acinetobacter baumannii]
MTRLDRAAFRLTGKMIQVLAVAQPLMIIIIIAAIEVVRGSHLDRDRIIQMLAIILVSSALL